MRALRRRQRSAADMTVEALIARLGDRFHSLTLDYEGRYRAHVAFPSGGSLETNGFTTPAAALHHALDVIERS